MLTRPSLRTALSKARAEVEQIAAGHPIGDAAARLFPEVYDGLLRAELADLAQLPAWAAIDANPGSDPARDDSSPA